MRLSHEAVATTSEIVSGSMKLSSGILEREWRAVVGKATVELVVVLVLVACRSSTHLESETASGTALNCF